KFKPDDHEAWNNRGNALGNLGRLEEAIASYDQAIKFKPDKHEAWNNRGFALRNLGRFEEAIASYDQAIKFKPDDHEAWNNRGFALLKLGKFEEASTCFDRAIELGSNYCGVFFNRAIAILGFDRWDEGMTALENAIKQIQDKEEISADDTELIISILFKNTQDSVVWKSRLTLLIQVFDKYEILSLLGQGLVKSIPTIMPETVSDKTAEIWLELWRELTSEYKEFQIPLRLLNTAVEYKVKKGDRRVFLELAIEERQLLEQVLKIE
ncbi:tetratricopeptide repeat protein, partial [Argonema galeatum]|uniref:tetratricopeptide repeat protein n=1 Tax=Argonema galeatum TaxID=2942762 RepID=UPI0020133E3E